MNTSWPARSAGATGLIWRFDTDDAEYQRIVSGTPQDQEFARPERATLERPPRLVRVARGANREARLERHKRAVSIRPVTPEAPHLPLVVRAAGGAVQLTKGVEAHVERNAATPIPFGKARGTG